MKGRLLSYACAGLIAGAGLLALGSAGEAASSFIIYRGQVVGSQIVTSPSISTVINRGTINGGSSTGLTVTSPSVTTITNSGSITSNTTGISVSGGTSKTITNTGSIVVNGGSGAVGIRIGP